MQPSSFKSWQLFRKDMTKRRGLFQKLTKVWDNLIVNCEYKKESYAVSVQKTVNRSLTTFPLFIPTENGPSSCPTDETCKRDNSLDFKFPPKHVSAPSGSLSPHKEKPLPVVQLSDKSDIQKGQEWRITASMQFATVAKT